MKRLSSIIWGCKFRLMLLYHYLVSNSVRKRISLREMMSHLFSPTMNAVAARESVLVKENDQYKYFRIRGYNDLFVYPASAPMYSLAMVLSESRPWHWHYYEIPQTAVVAGDVVVDCGSAEGLFAFRHQYTAGHIFIMEPLPLFQDSLKELFGQNNAITILPVAAGDKCQQAYLSMTSGTTALDATIQTSAGDGHALEVSVVTIDSLFASRGIKIDYLKADIEGFEENMIRGALETIRISKPKIAITTYHKGQNYHTLIELIKGVVPEYNHLIKGIHYLTGNPVMLHMWL
ncbi:MAG: FkbM family methyltransferase [Chitinophaga sp.]|uniref:FkbM family methyltransferase n=1 Tax=Chitinophaga sp. TaxID=1869181 RepID=UPI001B2D9CCF|nr:FkbM family methyltransferase [Chitinophaga sp.]MBO9732230.1 FkbM family methyltransferase [Chitinophaga sp.]